jgi:hypothetical protein
MPPEKRQFLRKGLLVARYLMAKLYCPVEFWLKRLRQPKAPV